LRKKFRGSLANVLSDSGSNDAILAKYDLYNNLLYYMNKSYHNNQKILYLPSDLLSIVEHLCRLYKLSRSNQMFS
jgi:hypothetical protein